MSANDKVAEGRFKTALMKALILFVIIALLAGTCLVAAAQQSLPRAATPSARNLSAGNEADYALTLRDPFSPIGYHLPMSEWQASAALSNAPPPSIDLKTKAKALLRVRGIVKRGSMYVANVNGTIVKAGDEVDVVVDGQRIVFVIHAISLTRIEIELKE